MDDIDKEAAIYMSIPVIATIVFCALVVLT